MSTANGVEVKEATCEQRISSQLENLEESCEQIMKHYYGEESEDGQDGFELYNEFPLSVQTRKVTTILLSWGGPSDFLKVEHEGGDIYSVEYHFQDWFDGAMREVREGSKVWEYAASVIETREECGY